MTLPTKEIKFSPETITLMGEEEAILNPFKGFIKLKTPTYIERMDLIAQISSNEKDSDSDKIASTKKLIEIAMERITEVDLVHTETETVIKDIETLGIYEEGAALINAAGEMLTKGVRLGKRTK